MPVTNTLALFFTLGYQGGTILQLAEMLGTTTDDILDADDDRMGDLLRLAQTKRRERIGGVNQELLEALKIAEQQMTVEAMFLPEPELNSALNIAREAIKKAEAIQ